MRVPFGPKKVEHARKIIKSMRLKAFSTCFASFLAKQLSHRYDRARVLKPHVSQSGPLFIGRLLCLSARPLIILYDSRVSSSQSHLLLGFVTNLLLFTPLGGGGHSPGGGGWVGRRDRMQMARLGNFLFSFQLIFRTKPGGNEQKMNKACRKKVYRWKSQ